VKPLTPEKQKEQFKREVELARMGKQVLDNEAFKQAMLARKSQIFDIFCKTKPDQVEVREKCYLTMINMLAFEEFFHLSMETGNMADMSLESLKEE